MYKQHSQLVVILLAGIFAVLLFGRDAVLGSMEGAVWIALAVGVPVLLIWMIVAFIRYLKREARAYRPELRTNRDQGLPWLYSYLIWPGLIGSIFVISLAVYRYNDATACKLLLGDCLQGIPYYW